MLNTLNPARLRAPDNLDGGTELAAWWDRLEPVTAMVAPYPITLPRLRVRDLLLAVGAGLAWLVLCSVVVVALVGVAIVWRVRDGGER